MTQNGKVYNYLIKKIEEDKCLHFSLIDPDLVFQTLSMIKKYARYSTEAGTDAILVGGSTIADQFAVDKVVNAIKEETDKPVIIFPGNINAFSKSADAVFFMSLLNSRNLYWIIESHIIGAPQLKLWGMEAISMAYIIISPGGTAGYVGDVKLIPRNKAKIAQAYALAAQYLGFKLVYFEAGSGVDQMVPLEMVKATSNFIDIPLIIGGGINTEEDAVKFSKTGASAIVQGTYIEKSVIRDKGEGLKKIIKAIKTVAKNR
ncbi:MAG: geranylgeranylglyceryl/heptaprenylglyceryl phosphate synthase [Candidatus Lokiarchaeota archaeon]|nr:geranylgeranylglyceryl/heptaprenylglyceryl phosphate synthase [Candidatus Lokiarchaeota archaeon]